MPLSTIISGITLAVVTAFASFVSKQFKRLNVEYGALVSSQRNQLKASIVRSYEEAVARGFITAMELETLNRRADSYAALHGDTYIETIRHHANTSIEIRGSIPPYTHPEETYGQGNY